MSTTPESNIEIRTATPDDAPALLAIYRPFVEETAVSFEVSPPPVAEFAARIEKSLRGWAWRVAEEQGQPIGYAYGSAHRERAAYRWSVEVSAYVDSVHRQRGIGRKLYTALFSDLEAKGFCNAYAGITLPNEGSVALHRALGFQPIGIFPAVGRKFGRWHDVAWWHRTLRETPPVEPERAASATVYQPERKTFP